MAMFPASRIPVWPFFVTGVIALVIGLVIVVAWWPGDYPEKSALVKLSGPIASTNVRDDFSGTSAGAILQGWTSTYITLECIDGEFRYSRNHPKSILVRDSVGGELDLWIDPSAIGSEAPITIWQIEEHNPYKRENAAIAPPEIFVSHAEIVRRLREVEQSTLWVGKILSLFGLAFLLAGVAGRRWNQRTLASGRLD